MKCSNCGTENRQGVRFCEECGLVLNEMPTAMQSENTCPTCGHANRSGIRFCEECGANLGASAKDRGKFDGSIVCPTCKCVNRPGIQFCEECGNPLNATHIPESHLQNLLKIIITVGGIVGGFLLICFAIGIFTLGPRAMDQPVTSYSPPAVAQNTNPPSSGATESIVEPSQTEPSVEQPSNNGNESPADAGQTPEEGNESPEVPTTEPLPPAPSEGKDNIFDRVFTFLGGGGGDPPDSDQDGLSDFLELDLANMYYPYLVYSADYETQKPEQILMRLYQVTPVSKFNTKARSNFNANGYYGPEAVLITFVMLYPRDDGIVMVDIPESVERDLLKYVSLDQLHDIEFEHDGDTEVFRILLMEVPGKPGWWQPLMLLINRHHDPAQLYYPNEFSWDGSHPRIYVSASKHAMYSSYEACDDYGIGWGLIDFEFCGTGGWAVNGKQDLVAAWPFGLNPDESKLDGINVAELGFNVGERDHPTYYRIPDNSFGLYENEFVWAGSPESKAYGIEAADYFCGGAGGQAAGTDMECGGGLESKWWPRTNTSQSKLADEISSIASNQFTAWYGSKYQIQIYTGDDKNAGTDVYIDIELQGDRFSELYPDLTDHYALSYVPGEFERGSQDIFDVGHYDLGELIGLKIGLYWPVSPPKSSEWFLDKIIVTEKDTNRQWTFSCTCWMDTSSHYDNEAGSGTVGPYLKLQPYRPPVPVANSWTQIRSQTRAVYIGGDEMFATDLLTEDLYHYDKAPFYWTRIGGSASAFAANNNGELFAIASDGNSIWQWGGSPDNWVQIGGAAKMIFAGGKELYSTSPDTGDIYRYNHSAFDWTYVGNAGRWFVVNNKGELFKISSDGESTWAWNGTSWRQIGGAAQTIYAGGSELFITSPQTGEIFRWEGADYNWTKIGRAGLTFTVNGSGQLFAIFPDENGVWLWTGIQNEWTKMGDSAADIFSGGNSGVCATNPDTMDLWCYK